MVILSAVTIPERGNFFVVFKHSLISKNILFALFLKSFKNIFFFAQKGTYMKNNLKIIIAPR